MSTYAKVFEALLTSQRASGVTLSGGKVHFYVPGSVTEYKAIYADRGKQTPAANPYTLSSDGTAVVYGDGLYDVVLKTAAGVTVATWEDVSLIDSAGDRLSIANYATLAAAVAAIGATKTTLVIGDNQSVSADLTIPATLQLEVINGAIITIASGQTLTINGPFSAGKIQVFAGSGTVKFGKGSVDATYPEWWGAKADGTTNDTIAIQAAIDAWISASNLAGTVKFSNATYAATTIILRTGTKYIGDRTALKALPSAEPGLIQIDAATPVVDAHMIGINLYGIPANATQHGIYILANGISRITGLWYSTFANMEIQYFEGHGIHSDCQDNASGAGADVAVQFLTFNNVKIWTTGTTTSRCLYALGQFGQVQFNNCQFDGRNSDAGTLNIELQLSSFGSGSDEPYSIDFNLCSFQTADMAIKANYAHSLNMNAAHFEGIKHGMWFINSSVIVDRGYFSGATDGVGGGYIVKANTASAVTFSNNTYSTCDSLLVASNTRNITMFGNNSKGYPAASTDYIVQTSGITQGNTVSVDGALLTAGGKTSTVTSGGNELANIYSNLGVGEIITLKAFTDPLVINATGNIHLSSYFSSNTITLQPLDTISFMKTDAIGTWWVVGVSMRVQPPVAVYADNAAATAGGLVAGQQYRTATGVLMIVY